MFEQGYGKLNILKSMKILYEYTPKVTLSPPYLDCTEDYMWPYNTQSLFYTSAPTIVNVTILNGMSVTGRVINKPTWHPYILQNGNLLNVSITYSEVLWPWSGWLGVKIGKKMNRLMTTDNENYDESNSHERVKCKQKNMTKKHDKKQNIKHLYGKIECMIARRE